MSDNKKMTEADCAQVVNDYLQKRISPNRIVREWKNPESGTIVDFAILSESDNKSPSAFIEVKTKFLPDSQSGKDMLKRSMIWLKERMVHVFIFSFNNGGDCDPTIFLLDFQGDVKTGWKEILSDEFCEILKKKPNASRNIFLTMKVEKGKVKEESEEAIYRFKCLSWITACMVSLLLFADIWLKLFTTERLIILGIIVGLILLPFLQQITFLGIVIKRRK